MARGHGSRVLALAALTAWLGVGLAGGADPASASRPSSRPITLIFRFDDYSAKSDTNLERKILAAFQRRGIPLTVSVVPRIASGSAYDPSPQEGLPLPDEKIELLRAALQSGGVEVALHGYAHQTVRRKIGNKYLQPFGRYHSEFIGVDEATQEKKILEGRDILEKELGVHADVFVPPWNGYDETTLKVLARAGFTTFSAARRGPVDRTSPLHFLPRTCDLRDIKDATAAARETIAFAPVIIALFHHYDFVENDPQAGQLTLPELDRLLDWVAAQDDVQVLTLGAASRSLPDLGARQFYWNRSALLWQVTPPWVNQTIHWPPRGVYLSLPAARRAKVFLWTVVLLLYGGLGLAGSLVARIGTRWFLRRHPALHWAARILSVIAFLGIAAYALWDLEPYWAGMAAIFWTAGFSAGLL
jgi:peptidoglycan/xylan/chitin deacetylase (PgdA/CDA1 family)